MVNFVNNLFLILILGLTLCSDADGNVKLAKNTKKTLQCDLSQSVIDEISNYRESTERIIDYVLNGSFKGRTYDELADFVDAFGPRLAGSQALEDSIDYLVEKTKNLGLDAHTEGVEVEYWNRSEESAAMIQPRFKKLQILGLGRSIATPPEGLTAEITIVKSFDELSALRNEDVQGKIVLYDPTFVSYGETGVYRYNGAAEAAKKGAIAALVRSITPFSINSPHTGNQNYQDGVVKIPVAAITLEDADLLSRIAKRGHKIVVNLKISGQIDGRISRNTIVDLTGSTEPNKYVVVSGHIDSWDVGQGAMDDAGGVFISWSAPVVLKQLGLVPKRTLKAIFFTAEEIGIIGANAYIKRHEDELNNFDFVMESDFGTFTPQGLLFKGTEEAQCILSEILKLTKALNTTELELSDSPGPDLDGWTSQGVPSGGLKNDNEKYFWFHHSDGDTVTVENTRDLDLATAFWTIVSYIVADLSFDIPK